MKNKELTHAQEAVKKRIEMLSKNNCIISDYHGDYYDESGYVGM